MLAKPLLAPILHDDALTRGLADPEAKVLVEWLVHKAETLADQDGSESGLRNQIHQLCRRGRAICRFVALWCHERQQGAAGQLAVAEQFNWPFPTPEVDAVELMMSIVFWENNDCPAEAM
jgi:hypothetical protein